MSIWSSTEVIRVSPIEFMLFPCHHIVPQVHSSSFDGVVEFAMGCRLTERLLKVQKTESLFACRPKVIPLVDAWQDRRPRQDAGVRVAAWQSSALCQFLLLWYCAWCWLCMWFNTCRVFSYYTQETEARSVSSSFRVLIFATWFRLYIKLRGLFISAGLHLLVPQSPCAWDWGRVDLLPALQKTFIKMDFTVCPLTDSFCCLWELLGHLVAISLFRAKAVALVWTWCLSVFNLICDILWNMLVYPKGRHVLVWSRRWI